MCFCVWHTQICLCGDTCKAIPFSFLRIRCSSLRICLWPSQCCIFWVISSLPTPQSLPETSITRVGFIFLPWCLFLYRWSSLLLVTPQPTWEEVKPGSGLVCNLSPWLCIWSFSSINCTSGVFSRPSNTGKAFRAGYQSLFWAPLHWLACCTPPELHVSCLFRWLFILIFKLK